MIRLMDSKDMIIEEISEGHIDYSHVFVTIYNDFKKERMYRIPYDNIKYVYENEYETIEVRLKF